MHTILYNKSGWAHAAQCGAVLLWLLLMCGCRGELSWGLDSVGGGDRTGAGDRTGDRPERVVAVIRRADVPRDRPTGKAWGLTNERVALPLRVGAWRGNGLRVGVMPREALDEFGQAMPTPLASSRAVMSQSKHDVAIIETPVLSPNLRFEVDLTRPPEPARFEAVTGGRNSRLRLLARLSPSGEAGAYTLTLTPQHYVPSPFDLIPRDPLEKELDGRVYEALSMRLKVRPDQIVVVGLYWPWPERLARQAEQGLSGAGTVQQNPRARGAGQAEAGETNAPDATSEGRGSRDSPATRPLPPAEPSDPAAPPPHLRGLEPAEPPADRGPADSSDERQDQRQVVTPPLPLDLGSVLLTSPGIGGVPTQTVLLITIERG